MIVLNIDVTKIDKKRLFDGKKGIYLDAVLIETPNSPHNNDYMIVQSVSKEEREKGIKGAILGNAKIIWTARDDSKPSAPEDESQDIPF